MVSTREWALVAIMASFIALILLTGYVGVKPNSCIKEEFEAHNFTTLSKAEGAYNWNIELDDGKKAILTSVLLPETLDEVLCCNGTRGFKVCKTSTGGLIQ